MIALWLALATAPAQDICPLTCTFPTVQAAVDSVAPGAVGVFLMAGGVHSGAVVIDGGRRITLTTIAPDPVVLAALPADGAVATVRGASTLNLTGISVDADSVRGIDVSEGSTLSLSLGLIFGRGIVGDGALVRLRDSSMTAFVYGFTEGFSSGDGGLIYAEDSDVDLSSCSLSDGSSQNGGGLYAKASGTRRSIHFDGCTLDGLGGILYGGGLAVTGELDVALTGLLVEGTSAQYGGVLAVLGDGPVVGLTATIGSSSEAYGTGGVLYQSGGAVSMVASAFSDGAAYDGGALAITGGTLELDNVVLLDNLAVVRAGAILAEGGDIAIRDSLIQTNSARDGGGLWIGAGATLSEFGRTTVCGNGATNGGGAWLDLSTDLEMYNVRFLDNLASDDGGGVRHRGTGALSIRAANLLGNTAGSAGGAAVSTGGEVVFTDALIGYSTGGIAIRRESGTPVVLAGGTAWWLNDHGDAADLSPNTPGAVVSDPRLAGYTPGEDCATMQDWGGWYGPLRDAGSVGLQDPDGSRADIGAYGGPDADLEKWTVDDDGDESPLLYDCDERDPEVHPQAIDVPYDGVDANCDGADDFDADGDGHRSPDHGGDDCDDTRADVFPGADEVASDPPVDQNCDGFFDADGDGFEPPEDCDDGDADAHPGAVDDDPSRDLDCDGFVDGPRLIRPVGCDATGQGPAGLLVWLPLILLGIRRGSGPALSDPFHALVAPAGRELGTPAHLRRGRKRAQLLEGSARAAHEPIHGQPARPAAGGCARGSPLGEVPRAPHARRSGTARAGGPADSPGGGGGGAGASLGEGTQRTRGHRRVRAGGELRPAPAARHVPGAQSPGPGRGLATGGDRSAGVHPVRTVRPGCGG